MMPEEFHSDYMSMSDICIPDAPITCEFGNVSILGCMLRLTHDCRVAVDLRVEIEIHPIFNSGVLSWLNEEALIGAELRGLNFADHINYIHLSLSINLSETGGGVYYINRKR